MQSIIDKVLSNYKLTMNSKVSEITDALDYVSFILECEEYYNFVINDDEAVFFEEENLSLKEIEEFFLFLKNSQTTDFIHGLITNNINRLKSNREEYESYIVDCRDKKIKSLGL
jgi:hypothetical protein